MFTEMQASCPSFSPSSYPSCLWLLPADSMQHNNEGEGNVWNADAADE